MGQKIFIVEDDRDLAETLEQCLIDWGYEVRSCRDFNSVLVEMAGFAPDLVLLDLGLPLYNGYHWCKYIRAESQVPIMIISGQTDPLNQVMALELGADDYLEKPFASSLLIAKVKALLRRAYTYKESDSSLAYAGLRLEPETARVYFGQDYLDLSVNELKLLASLIEAKGAYVSRDVLAADLWGQADYVADNTITVNLSRLRRKLIGLVGQDLIVTKKGLGYGLRDWSEVGDRPE